MTKNAGTSSTSNPNIEWVTLISKDNYQFVIDKRFALRSIFIRSMLGESKTSNIARRGQKASHHPSVSTTATTKVQTVNASAAEVLETVSDRKNSSEATMNDRATPPPPPKGSGMTNEANGSDPDGYVNPFASNTQTNENLSDNDDLEGKFGTTFESGFAEAQSKIVKFPDIRGIILEKVIEYLCWNAKYFNAKDEDIPDFKHRIRPEIAVEL